MDQKLDKILEVQTAMLIVMERHENTLKEHVRRTELLEKDVAPLKAHVTVVAGLAKVVVFSGVLVSIAAGVYKLLGK